MHRDTAPLSVNDELRTAAVVVLERDHCLRVLEILINHNRKSHPLGGLHQTVAGHTIRIQVQSLARRGRFRCRSTFSTRGKHLLTVASSLAPWTRCIGSFWLLSTISVAAVAPTIALESIDQRLLRLDDDFALGVAVAYFYGERTTTQPRIDCRRPVLMQHKGMARL